MKKIALSALVLSAFQAAAWADTNPPLEVVDTGPDAIVVARGLELADGSFKVRSNRIEVSLEGRPSAQNVSTDDRTIGQLGIRIRSTGERRLTVTIKAGRDAARRIARRARVEQVGDNIQIVLGRTAGTEPVAAFINDIDELDEAMEIEEPPTEATEETAAAAPVTTAPEATAAADKPGPTPAEGGGAGSVVGLLLVFAAAVAAGLGYREWQKRRGTAPVMTGIDVLSVRNIGPKTRLMLVAVGNREMLLTVGPTGSNVLGRWRRNDHANSVSDGFLDEQPPLPAAAPIAAPPRQQRTELPMTRPNPPRQRPSTAAQAYSRRSLARGSSNPDEAVAEWNHRPTSPAIRGILELRDQTLALDDVMNQNDDEVDREWEQALAGGTRAGRLR